MAKRVVLGKANDGSSDIYGLFVSKPGVEIVNGSGVLCDQEDMLFDSRKGKFAQVLANLRVSTNPHFIPKNAS